VKLTDDSVAVLKGTVEVRLIEPKSAMVKKSAAEDISWENVDRGLFESLRELRRTVANEKSVAPFVIFSDATLREMAAVRPASATTFINIRGIGQRKAAELGPRFVEHIVEYCRAHNVTLDAQEGSRPRSWTTSGGGGDGKRLAPAKLGSVELFEKGMSIEVVAANFGVATLTAWKYMHEWIEFHKPRDISRWIDSTLYQRIAEASKHSEDGRLKPIFEHLGGSVPYEQIRAVVTHIRAMEEVASA
jgi:ATP-dependent DNA helicase RecQ